MLEGWVIIIGDTRNWIGKPSDDRLMPAYELVAMMQPVPGRGNDPPQIGVARYAMPVLTFASIRSIPMPEGVRIEVDEMSDADRRELGRAISACEELVKGMRAQGAGIVLAPPGSRVRQ